MPAPTTNDIVGTGYVHNNYSGSYQTHSSGQFYDRTYDNAPGFFWFDNDRDGFFEYGRRDDGQGHWSTFLGFYWDDTPPPPPRDRGDRVDEPEPQNSIFGYEPVSPLTEDGWMF